MQNGKRIALIIGGIGMLLCVLMFFFVRNVDIDTISGFPNFVLMASIWFTMLLTLAVFIYFLISYFNDFKVHPEFRGEMRTISIYFFGSLILGLIFAFIFGGMDPVTRGDGTIIDSKGLLLFVSTVIWTSIIMLIAAFVWSMRPLFAKK